MSEYWVSKKKYYCQYCEIYIADDVPSRNQHENGLRHKGNKDRFIRGLYKAGVKKKQESEEEKREMKRVEEAAQAAYARDIGSGLAKPAASSSSAAPAPAAAAPKPKPPPPKPSDPYANYTTAASLGITDPDIDRLVAEAAARKSEGRVGDWVAVAPPPPPLPPDGAPPALDGVKPEPGTSAGGVRKREDATADDDDARHFKMRKRTAAVGLGEIYDPGVIQVTPRVATPPVKAEMDAGAHPAPGPALGGDAPQSDARRQGADLGPRATEMPAWSRRAWKWAGEDDPSDEPSHPTPANAPPSDPPASVAAVTEEAVVAAKPENGDAGTQLAPNGVVKGEPADPPVSLGEPPGGSLFRKRRAPGGTSTRGRRQF